MTEQAKMTSPFATISPSAHWHMGAQRVRELYTRMRQSASQGPYPGPPADDEDDGSPQYTKRNGHASIPIVGAITDYPCAWDDYFGLCPASRVESQLADAVADPSIKTISLMIDTPGGLASASGKLADAVRGANASKPVTAIVVGLCCSGGYYAASQAGTIVAGGRTEIGCIGTYCLLVDDSKFWADMGVDWKLVSSGGVKGLGADGKVTQELIDDTQRVIDDLTAQFVADVAIGRGVTTDKAKTWADGRTWLAAESLTLGLIDRIASVGDAMAAISKETQLMNAEAFKAYAAANPEAAEVKELKQAGIVAGHKTGKAEGATEERARASGILDAHGLKDHAAAVSLAAGHDVETAQMIARVAAKAKVDAETKAAADKATNDAALAEKDKEIKRLQFEASGQRGVGTGGQSNQNKGDGDPGERPETSDPKALKEWADKAAAHEWNSEPDKRQGYSTKDRFVAIRSRELMGQHKTLIK